MRPMMPVRNRRKLMSVRRLGPHNRAAARHTAPFSSF